MWLHHLERWKEIIQSFWGRTGWPPLCTDNRRLLLLRSRRVQSINVKDTRIEILARVASGDQGYLHRAANLHRPTKKRFISVQYSNQKHNKNAQFLTNISVQFLNISGSGTAALQDKIPPWETERCVWTVSCGLELILMFGHRVWEILQYVLSMPAYLSDIFLLPKIVINETGLVTVAHVFLLCATP